MRRTSAAVFDTKETIHSHHLPFLLFSGRQVGSCYRFLGMQCGWDPGAGQ